MNNYLRTLKLFNRDTRLYLGSVALSGFGYVGIYIMLFNLYLLRLGYEPSFIGLANGVAQLGVVFFSLGAGMLGRRWGSRRMSIIGLGISTLGPGLVPLGEGLPGTWQATWLVASYLLSWLGGALYLVNGIPFLMSVTNPEERGHVFAVREALVPLVAFAGSLVGGLLPGLLAIPLGGTLEQSAPYRYSLLIAAIPLIPAMLILIATREVKIESVSKQKEPPVPAPFDLIIFLALVVLFQVAGYSVTRTFFNVYLDSGLRLPLLWIGGLTAIGQLLGAPGALLAPVLVARWGRRRAILSGLIGMALGMMVLGLIPHWSAATLGYIAVQALMAFTVPIIAVCQQGLMPPAWRATMSGASMMATGLGNAGIALSGGYLITTWGYSSLFLTAAALSAAGAAIFWGYTWAPSRTLVRRSERYKAQFQGRSQLGV